MVERRLFLEQPNPRRHDNMIFTPFKLWIKRAFLSQHRFILFDIQEYEQQDLGEIKREVAEALGQEWQQAIDEYWRRCEVAQDWWRRSMRIKREGQRKREGRIEDVRWDLKDVKLGLENVLKE